MQVGGNSPKKSPPLAKCKKCEQKSKTLLPAKQAPELSLQQVTQNLTTIIKNLQTQIQNVGNSRKSKIEEIPSSLIETKKKQFFKPQILKAKTIGNIVKKPADNTITKKNSIVVKSSVSSSSRKVPSLKSSSTSNKIQRSISVSDPLKVLKGEVHSAVRDHKTFTVRGMYSAIRKALLSRGWVERFHTSYKNQLKEDFKRFQSQSIQELLPHLKNQELTVMVKQLIKSKLLGNQQVDFYWGTNDEVFKDNSDTIKYTLINKLKRDIFSYTNKQGMCEANKMAHWYQKKNVSKLNHPRSYCIGKNGDLKSFVDDFHTTAAMSLLKWIVKVSITKESKLLSSSGKIPLEVYDFALNECCKTIKRGKHEDIDGDIEDASEDEWNQFLDYYYKIVHYSNHFKMEQRQTEDLMVRKCNFVLNNLKEYYPSIEMDGLMNIWMVKPTSSSRGRGIHICRTLQYILKTVKQNGTNVRYIIQKYIERPLLIHNTKFDIRQWFLISSTTPLTIWMYKECYLRFSSQTYNLRKLHESIHLTNNAVQCKYKCTSIDAALPSYNMWSSTDFQTYLTNIGYPNAYKSVIYSGMKQGIIAAVLMHQEKVVIRKNSFELYGADFILNEDFQPWLLEINSNPALYASTPVTARMCPKVLEDLVKVIVDHGRYGKANTGEFELVYREHVRKLPPPTDLVLMGRPVRTDYFFTPNEGPKIINSESKTPVIFERTEDSLKGFGEDIKNTLTKLLRIIQNEKNKRELKHKKIGSNSLMEIMPDDVQQCIRTH